MTSTLAVAHFSWSQLQVQFQLIAHPVSSGGDRATRLFLLHPAPAAEGPGGPAVAQGSGFEVGDEVQTVGGVIGTVLEVHGDRYTLLTGALGDDGNLDGPQPTRIVFVRQAIAKKIEPIEDVRVDDEPVQDVRPARASGKARPTQWHERRHECRQHDDIDDVGGDGAASSGDLGGEAEEA